MAAATHSGPGSKLNLLIGFTVVAFLLRVGRDVLVPVALAILLVFLVSPVVDRLVRWKVRDALAILMTAALAFAVIGAVGAIVSQQFFNLVDDLPNHEENIRAKIAAVKAPGGEGGIARTKGLIETLRQQIETNASTENLAGDGEQRPIPVEIRQPPPTSMLIAQQMLAPLISPLGMAALVALLVILMLFQRNDLRERLIKMISYGDLNLATEAVDDATRRISRYLTMQLIVNSTYGLPIGIGLYLIGIPNAVLWGFLAIVLRFIPFVGPWIAAAFPILLAIAIDPGWTMAAYTLGLFLVAELISNNVVEPWLYGASTGVSNVALVIAAVFWTWLWGPVGLLLSTPITVCLMVIGKRAPGFQFLNILLGNDRVLDPPARLYQRMLAMDPDAIMAMAEEYIAAHSLMEFYDGVLAPALILAEVDRHRGSLAESRQKFILQTTHDLVDELEKRSEQKGLAADGSPGERPRALTRTTRKATVLGLSARDDADELTTEMLAHLLRERGIEAQVCPITTISDDCVNRAASGSVRVVFISALPPAAVPGARRVATRLRERCPGTRILIGIWSPTADRRKLQLDLRSTGADVVVTRFTDALEGIERLLDEASDGPPQPAPIPANEDRRMAAVNETGLLDTDPEEVFDTVTRELAHIFQVPMSLVTVVDTDRQFWKSEFGLPADLSEAREAPRETSMCGHVVASQRTMVVEDTLKDRRFASNPFILERGIRFYAGAPLLAPTGGVLGSLCVIDTKPRTITNEESAFLEMRAAEVSRLISARQTAAGNVHHTDAMPHPDAPTLA